MSFEAPKPQELSKKTDMGTSADITRATEGRIQTVEEAMKLRFIEGLQKVVRKAMEGPFEYGGRSLFLLRKLEDHNFKNSLETALQKEMAVIGMEGIALVQMGGDSSSLPCFAVSQYSHIIATFTIKESLDAKIQFSPEPSQVKNDVLTGMTRIAQGDEQQTLNNLKDSKEELGTLIDTLQKNCFWNIHCSGWWRPNSKSPMSFSIGACLPTGRNCDIRFIVAENGRGTMFPFVDNQLTKPIRYRPGSSDRMCQDLLAADKPSKRRQ